MLRVIPNYQEVKQALFSLPSDKAPRSDGFPTFFFHDYSEVVKMDVVKAVQEFFGAKNLLKELDSTFLVLIPKIHGVDSMDKFRPITNPGFYYDGS